MTHVLIWHHSADASPPAGAKAQHGWREYRATDGAPFRCVSEAMPISPIVEDAVEGLISAGHTLSVAWGPIDPTTVTSAEIEPALRALHPAFLLCRERRGSDRWVTLDDSSGISTIAAASAQAFISSEVVGFFSTLRQGRRWSAKACLIRPGVNAESLGIVPPLSVTPDEAIALVATDSAVIAASRRADAAIVGSFGALVEARLVAQARAGIVPEQRAPIASGEVEDLLLPVVSRMLAPTDEAPSAIIRLRRDLRRRYGDHAETVERFALATYRHGGGIEALRAAAAEPVPAETAA